MYRPLLRRIRRNRFVSALAWRVATPLHAIASWMSRLLAQKVKRNGGAVTYDGITLRFPPNVGVDFLSSIHWRGIEGFEPDVWRVLRELIPHSHCFVDAGAHIGFYAVLAKRLNPAIELFAFEPVPQAFAEAKQFLAANGIPAGGLFQVALSDQDGDATLYLPASVGVSTCGSLASPRSNLQHAEIRVSCRRIDSFFSALSINAPITIKIDVEDHEHAVLNGAKRLIQSFRPIIVCELLFRAHYNSKTIGLIDELDYAAFAITREGCFRMNAIDFSYARSFRDFLLVPTERFGSDQCFLSFDRLGDLIHGSRHFHSNGQVK